MDSYLRKTIDYIIYYEKFVFDEIASRDVLISLACGGLAGVAAKTAVAPAERVKMSFQISSDKFSFMSALSRGNDMVRFGGIRSLWKGHSTTIIRVLPFSAMSFAVHDYCQQKFKESTGKDKLPFELKFLAGSIAGSVATLATYPLDVLRIRLALSPTSSWREAMSKGGMFQGLSPTMLGIIPYAGTTWMCRETLQEAFPVAFKRKQTVMENFIINSLAGLCGQFVTYPLDIARRRMQMADNDGFKLNLRSTLRHLFFSEGIQGLSKGFSMNIIKGPITLGISLTSYDVLLAWMRSNPIFLSDTVTQPGRHRCTVNNNIDTRDTDNNSRKATVQNS